MGYYVTLNETNAYIPETDLHDAYMLLCEINMHNNLKGGGSYPREDREGPHPGVWFSWMPWNYPDVFDTAQAVLEYVGFDMYTDDNGDLHFCGYDNKTGDEDKFLLALTPVLCSKDSDPVRFLWVGEDYSMWVQEMHESPTTDYKELVTKQARITWE